MTSKLIDTYNRIHKDLRISITDRCNFRCTYCMPEEGLDWTPREDLLTFEEIERLASLLVKRFGVESIRLTGGEPTVRANLADLISRLSQLPVDLSMTTNGVTLPLMAEKLKAAGLNRINISLDSLHLVAELVNLIAGACAVSFMYSFTVWCVINLYDMPCF